MPQILVEQLAKRYSVAERDPGLAGAVRGIFHRRRRTIDALIDVSFSLEAGELLGFIGPNGAGKSTTIKILSGILRPDGGRVEVGGLVPARRSHSSRRAHRRRVRTAHATLVGSSRHRRIRSVARHLPRRERGVQADARRAGRDAPPRAAARSAGATIVARPTHARRDRVGATPRAAHSLSRRADDRSRRALQARRARVREAPQS